MAFSPPGFPIIMVNTLNLDWKLSTLLGRYNKLMSKASPSTAALSPHLAAQSPLEILLARTNYVIDCKTTNRTTARDVFKQLSIELREVLNEKDEAKNKQATFFLLGALLHRYFRIIKEYDRSYSRWIVAPNPKKCSLFKAIRSALKLSDEMPEHYKSKDLELLDVTTIVTALEVFRDNMLMVPEGEQYPKYMKYAHFKADKNFEFYLNEIIEEHSVRGESVLRQFKAVNFIQSLSQKVESEQKKVEEIIINWTKELQRDQPDFSKLNAKTIKSHLKAHVPKGLLRELVADLLYTGVITSKFLTLDHRSFLYEMKKANLDTASHTVFGGYALLLQSKDINDDMKFCIREVLGIADGRQVLSSKDLLNGIKFLEIFMANNPDVELNYDYFCGKLAMNTQIAQNKLVLNKLIKEQSTLPSYSLAS